MRAVTIRDGALVVEEHPDPEPGHGQILVRVRGAGLNGADMLQRRGAYPAPPGEPARHPGLEMAGEVVAVGPGTHRFSEGDRVMAVVGGGGQAELAVVHERAAMPVPDAARLARRRAACPRSSRPPTTRSSPRPSCARGAPARARRGRRRGYRGRADRPGQRRAVTATVRREELRAQVERLGARAIAPEGLRRARPLRRHPRAGRRAATSRRTSPRWRGAGASR